MSDPFPQTRWSLVLEAQATPDSPDANRALNELCQAYWFPIYSYARHRGLSSHDAEDSTQSFFTIMLERESFKYVAQEKGRMRSFLLTAMKRHLTNEWRESQAQKRGGGQYVISIDSDAAEHRLAREPVASGETPDAAFEKSWAHTLLAEVYAKLEAFYTGSNQEQQFTALRPFLTWGSEKDNPYSKVAAQIGMSEGSVRTAVHRMRTRYRELLEAEIRETVATPEEAADELLHLKKVLAGR